LKEKTINLEDLGFCSQNCNSYSPKKEEETIVCQMCGLEFKIKGGNKTVVDNAEFDTCPSCGNVVNLKRDDKTLSKNGV